MTGDVKTWFLFCKVSRDFKHCSGVSNFNFEQVNTTWDRFILKIVSNRSAANKQPQEPKSIHP